MKNDDFSKLNKAGMFTDIHFGRKNASDVHNSDCIEFIEWFIDQCKIHNVDHLIFLGDWFEHRDSISGKTLDYSHKAMKRIKDELGDLPFFFIVGNHDLVYRNTRNAFNTKIFEPFPNMIIVEKNLSITIGNKAVLFCPFLFEKEYPKQISEINSHDVVFGHFEFKGFVVTGDTKKMDHGPEHSDFKKCKRIFTGHFHKRQNKDNVYYIGNTFPMDYSDANDTNRGMSIYEYDSDTLTFIDWDDGPSYMKCDLSDMIKSPKKYLREKGTVTCTADQKITYEEMITLQKSLTKKYNLRELNIQEPPEDYTISDEIDEEDLESEDRSEVVRNLLRKVVSKDIDNELLIKHFENAGKGIK
jgi:DNA repair exonuclease SbcCD nuclease subunit